MRRLYRLSNSKHINDDFYTVDVETAHRPNVPQRVFYDSRKYNGELHWKLEATQRAFVFGVIYGRNYTKVCHSVHEMQHELKHPRFRRRKVFAHNGGVFDFPCIFGNPFDVDPEIIFNGKFISFTNGVCTFADSTNIFVGMSIDVIGKMLGLKKTGMSNNYGVSVWPRDYARDVNGCIRDCQILWDALLSTFEFAGSIKITQASLSLTYYRRHHQPFNIDHNENAKNFYGAYYGGRTECFRIGKVHGNVIDVNSMYPYHLRSGVFPNPRTLKYYVDVDPRELKTYFRDFEGMADCTVEHYEKPYGFLPYKTDSKLLFPVGTFRGKWCFPELRFALEHKAIRLIKCHSITYGERMLSPFEGFVNALFDIKLKATLEGDEWLVSMVKYYLNMLYGKFGQKNDEKSIYLKDYRAQYHVIQEYATKGKFKRLIPFSSTRTDAMLVVKSAGELPSYCIPSFAAYVTSLGRVQLLKKMLEFDSRGVLYCDTDSIFFTNPVGVESSNALGEWKLENKIITNIDGLKNYSYHDDKKAPVELYRSKGVPSLNFWHRDPVSGEWNFKQKTFKLFDGDDVREVKTVERTGDKSFVYYNLLKTKEALKRGIEPGVLTRREKTLTGQYDKRIVNPDGTTKPIKV